MILNADDRDTHAAICPARLTVVDHAYAEG
jgi:hypothetical protein